MGIFTAIFAVTIFFGYSSYITSGRSPEAEAKKVIAEVNGLKINAEEFNMVYEQQSRMFSMQGSLSPLQDAMLRSSILNQLIDQRIRISAAKEKGIAISRGEIKQKRKKIVDEQMEQYRQMVAGNQKKKISDKKFNELLGMLTPPKTIKSLRKEIESDISTDAVRDQLMVEKLEAQLRASVGKIDDKRVKDSFKQAKIRQIVFRVGSAPEAQVKRKAEEVLKKVKAGEDFAKLAEQYSDDEYSKKEAIYMPLMFDRDLQNLKAGQTSRIMKALGGDGYRIVKVEEVKLELPNDFEKNKKQHAEQIKMTLENMAMYEFLDKVRKDARIKVYDTELNGYWLADRSEEPGLSQAERDKRLNEAIEALNKATRESPNAVTAYCKLVDIYANKKQDLNKAINILVDILDTRQIVEHEDLRMMLGQFYMQSNQKEKAIKQLQDASEMIYEKGKHEQLKMMFTQLGRPDLAAKEDQWIAEYEKANPEPQMPPISTPVAPESKPKK